MLRAVRWMRWGSGTALLAAVVVALSLSGAPADADPAGAPTPLANPVWLCEPGMPNNPCDQDLAGNPQVLAPNDQLTDHYPSGATTTLDSTVVAADGSTGYQPYTAPHDPPVDCFYVYPTVDVLPNPLLQVGSLPPSAQDQEMAVTLAQVARLSHLCRLFVPVYRQVPLPGLLLGASYATDLMDIGQAWTDYWTHHNIDPATHQRRGVILLGHSQGSAVLSQFIQSDVDNDPAVRASLVSAVLLGGNVQVPIGAPDGGGNDPASTFQHLPACQRSDPAAPIPVDCVIAYSSYDQPPGQILATNSVFGRNTAPGHEILCVNPAALLTGADPGSVTPLDAYLPTSHLLNGNILDPAGSLGLILLGFDLPSYPTGFARYPDTLRGQCASQTDASGNASWLQITGGAALLPASSQVSPLGLHVVDYNIDQGDLFALLAAQSSAWLAAKH